MAYKSKREWEKDAKRRRLSLQVNTIRRSKRMSIEELADKCGYEPSKITQLENGNFLPDQDKNKDIQLANALGVSLNQLWGRKRFETYDSGQPKLTETEKTAITLLAPMYKAMSEEGRAMLLSAAITILLSENAEVEWDTYTSEKEKNITYYRKEK